MVTVTHLLKFFQIAFRQWRPFVFLFTGGGFLDGRIVYKRHFHIAVEELGKHEIFCRQISLPPTSSTFSSFDSDKRMSLSLPKVTSTNSLPFLITGESLILVFGVYISMPHVLSDIETRFRKFIKKHGLSMRFIDI